MSPIESERDTDQVDVDPGMTESGMSPITEDNPVMCRRRSIFGDQAHGDVGVDLFGGDGESLHSIVFLVPGLMTCSFRLHMQIPGQCG